MPDVYLKCRYLYLKIALEVKHFASCSSHSKIYHDSLTDALMTSEPYKESYIQAISLMQEGEYGECRRHGQYNLTDPSPPCSWIIKNLLLIAHVSVDWYDAEEWRRHAQHAWYITNRMTGEDEADAKELLQKLRRG